MSRVKLKSLVAEFEYSDGTSKRVEIDIDASEALFWSERAVQEILAPFYEKKKKLSDEEVNEFEAESGKRVDFITPEVVIDLWNTPVDGKAGGDLPIAIEKGRKCIPTRTCKRC